MDLVQLALAEIYDLCEENDVIVTTKDYKGVLENLTFNDGYDSS